MKDKITIILASYNGERYLSEQIDSLISQTYENWELLIRDDCSRDRSAAILSNYCSLDLRIKILNNEGLNLGAAQNFSCLLENVVIKSTYIMFCDQDDIWLPDKLEKTLAEMKRLEANSGNNVPVMIYGTYKMINENGHDLDLNVPDYSTVPALKLLLSQNYIYGCTMMINRSLAAASCPIPHTAENHDYWISLIAVLSNARVGYINKPLLLYRQHSNNVSGSYKNASTLSRIKRIFNNAESRSIAIRYKMFQSLAQRGQALKIENGLLNGYIVEVSKGGINAFIYCIKNGIRRTGGLQTILFYFNLLRTNRS